MMSILKEIYEYKIDFVNNQKKLHTQSDILNKLENITSQDFSFSKKLKDEMSRTSIIGELKRASPSLGNFVNEDVNINEIDYYFSNSIARSSKTMSDCRSARSNYLKRKTGS